MQVDKLMMFRDNSGDLLATVSNGEVVIVQANITIEQLREIASHLEPINGGFELVNYSDDDDDVQVKLNGKLMSGYVQRRTAEELALGNQFPENNLEMCFMKALQCGCKLPGRISYED